MPDFYDRLETRTSSARQTALFRDLRHVLTIAKPRAPALRAQLKGMTIATIMGPADLAAIPLRRRSDLLEAQREASPFGGFAALRLAGAAQCFVAPDGLVSLGGPAKDWFGLARGLHAAGLRKGELVLNGFSYELDPRGHMVDAGARALCCPVLPAGAAPLPIVAAAAARLAPSFFCGAADRLKALLDHAASVGLTLPSLRKALVIGPLSAGLRHEFALRGIVARLAYAPPELGLVAFESGEGPGLVVNEGLIFELLAPGPDTAMQDGEGEVVVTRINADYPLVRFATGDVSSVLRDHSPCGRTNLVIRAPTIGGAAERHAGIGPAHLAEIARHHPDLGRMQLVLRRPVDRDEPHLKVEHGDNGPVLGAAVAETLHRVTALRGTVEFLSPGSLGAEDPVVLDERPFS